MHLLMPLTIAALGKAFATYFAFIWFFSSVCSFVRLKSSILSKSFRAVPASIGPLSCMLVHVGLEIAVLGEGLRTHLALVRFVIAVNQQVTL